MAAAEFELLRGNINVKVKVTTYPEGSKDQINSKRKELPGFMARGGLALDAPAFAPEGQCLHA